MNQTESNTCKQIHISQKQENINNINYKLHQNKEKEIVHVQYTPIIFAICNHKIKRNKQRTRNYKIMQFLSSSQNVQIVECWVGTWVQVLKLWVAPRFSAPPS